MPRYSQSEREKMLIATRERLMDAAVEEFSHKGYTEANINQISLAAGLAKGTVYNYFSSKQELLLALIDEIGRGHFSFIAERVRQVESPEERLIRFFEAGFAFVETYPARARLMIATLYGPETDFRLHMGQVYMPMFRMVANEILEPGMTAGVFRPSTLMATASLLMTIYLGTCSQTDEKGKPIIRPQEVASFSLEALRKRD